MAEAEECNHWGNPARHWWWPYCPLIVLSIIMLIVTVSMSWFGRAFVAVDALPDDLKDTKYVPIPANQAEAQSLRDMAARFRAKAAQLEGQAVEPAPDAPAGNGQAEKPNPAPPTSAKDLKDQADLFRDWAQAQEKKAQAIETQATANATVRSQRDATRIIWAYVTTIDIILVITALAVGYATLLTLFRNAEGAEKRRFLSLIFVISIIGPVSAFLSFKFLWKENEGVPSRLLNSYLGDVDGTNVFNVVTLDNGLHVAGAWLYIMVAAAILAFPRLAAYARSGPGSEHTSADNMRPEVLEEEAWEFANAMRLLRLMLYILALLLVVYVLSVRTLHHWSLAFLNPDQKELFAAVQTLATSAVTMRSLQATMLISAIYLPSAFMLRMLAWELANRALPGKTLQEQDEWLKTRGLSYTTNWEQLKPIVAMISPLVAGPLAELIQSLLK